MDDAEITRLITSQRFDLAEQGLRTRLSTEPQSQRLRTLLGRVVLARGRSAEAVQILQPLVAEGVRDAAMLDDLGVSLRAAGRLPEAITTLQRALEVDRGFEPAWYHLGNALKQAGRTSEAIEALERSTLLNPRRAEAWCNLGNTHWGLGDKPTAENLWRRALMVNPKLPEANIALGRYLSDAARPAEAIPFLEAAVQARPDNVDVRISLAHAQKRANRLEPAVVSWMMVTQARPDSATAHYNLGNALRALGRNAEAIAAYEASLRLDPENVETMVNLGSVVRDHGDGKRAIGYYRQALARRPEMYEAWTNLGIACGSIGDHAGAIEAYRRCTELKPESLGPLASLAKAKMLVCDWDGLDGMILEIRRRAVEAPLAPLDMMAFGAPIDEQRRNAERNVAEIGRPETLPAQPWEPAAGRRLRIGYLSGDLRDHAVGYVVADLFKGHDRSNVEVFGYSFTPPGGSGSYRGRIARGFDHYTDIQLMSNREAAVAIRADRLDVLIDLNAMSGQARWTILAHRPAPLQIWLGGMAGPVGVTIGADGRGKLHDWSIADEVVVPRAEGPLYGGPICWIDRCVLMQSARPGVADPPTRAECGLPDDAIVLCAFNTPYKLSRAFFEVWARAVRSSPKAVLWMVAHSAPMRESIEREAARCGIPPERLVFAAHMSQNDYLGRLQLADLFLDSIPYSAGTSAGDALWCGLPLLTVRGESWVGRVATSHLLAQGFPELVAESLEDYEQRLLRLVHDRAGLADLRRRVLAVRDTGPVFDTQGYARRLEVALREMVRIRQAGELPRDFAI